MYVRRVLLAAATLLAAGVVASVGFVLWPLAAGDLVPAPQSGVVITDRAGAVLRTSRASDGSRFRWVALSSMEPSLPAAFVATEDRGFYSHHGIEWLAALRAARDNLVERRKQRVLLLACRAVGVENRVSCFGRCVSSTISERTKFSSSTSIGCHSVRAPSA